MLYVLLALSLGLMLGGYFAKKPQLAVGASIAWFLLGYYSYTLVVILWDIYYCLFILSMALSLASILEIVVLVREAQGETEKHGKEEEIEGEFKEERDWQRERKEWRLGGGSSRPVLRLPPTKPSNYSKTGVHEEKK